MPETSFSKTLRSWRDRNGWKQWRAAQILGVPFGTYGSWERGRTEPRAIVREAVLAKVGGTAGGCADAAGRRGATHPR